MKKQLIQKFLPVAAVVLVAIAAWADRITNISNWDGCMATEPMCEAPA